MAKTINKRRRIHVSKNKKKSWNKYSDIKEIDDFLEEQRLEERIGDVSGKTNEQLFFIQNTAENVLPAVPKKNKPLRCLYSITAYSKVPIPVPENSGIIGKKQKKCISKAIEKRLKNIQLAKKPQRIGREALSSRAFYDLWAEGNQDKEVMNHQKPKVPCHLFQNPSLLPPVEIPHPGASYNPTHEDHQKLVLEAVLVEQTKEKEEQHLKRVLTDMFPTREEAPTHESWLQEMSQGLYEEADHENAIDHNDEGLFEMGNPPVRSEDRKTKAQKRKKKIIEAEERKRKLAKTEKKMVHDVYRLRSIKAELKEQDEKSQEKQEEKEKKEIERMFKPHTLSRYKYEPQDLEVHLTEELPDSLRELKVEGNLLEDRFKSLQRRNIIEPRVKQRRKRKYKLKVQIKRSHRDFK